MTNKKYYTTLLFYLAAFFLPVLIMIDVLYSQKIYPGSERTILTIYFMEMGASFTPLQVDWGLISMP